MAMPETQPQVTSPEPVLIVGAGPAGLATAACLKRHGLSPTLLESATEVGASWAQHYHRLQLHTVRGHSGLPHWPMPRSYPRYPSRDQVVEYLQAYARRFQLAVALGTGVQHARRFGGCWELQTPHGLRRCSRVVFATGMNRAPFTPAIEGAKEFCGEMLHSRRYKSGERFAGKRVLVVGCGNSGAEIALDLLESGAEPSLVVRSPVHVLRRELFTIPAQQLALVMQHLPEGLVDWISARAVQRSVGDLSRFGIHRPAASPLRHQRETGRQTWLDIGTIDRIKQGRIAVRPELRRLTATGAVFADGSQSELDAIVFATGYRCSLEGLIEGVERAVDERGRPSAEAPEQLPGAYFVGFHVSGTGILRDIALQAVRVAARIDESLRGEREP